MRTKERGKVVPELKTLASKQGHILHRLQGLETTALDPLQRGSIQHLTEYVQNASAIMSRASIANRLGKSFGDNRDVYQVCGYPKILRFQDHAARYLRQDIARRINDAYPNATWRGMPEIYETEDKDETAFELSFKELSKMIPLWNVFNRLDILSGLGHYAILLMGFDDVHSIQDWSKEVVLANPTSNEKRQQDRRRAKGLVANQTPSQLLYVHPYTELDCKIRSLNLDTSDARFGYPMLYQVQSVNSIDPNAQGGLITIHVHWTRIIHAADNRLGSEIYGLPRLEVVWNRLQDMELIMGGSAEMFWRGGFPGYSFEAEQDADFSEGMDDLQNEIEDYVMGLNRYMRLQGVTVKPLTMQVADPKGHVEVQVQMIAAATGIPQRILLGTEEGKLAGGQDQENWMARVDERRKSFAEPQIIRPFVDRLIDNGLLEAPSEENGYTIKWPDINAMSDQEKATCALTITQACQAYVQGGIEGMMSLHQFFTQVLKWTEEMVEANSDEIQDAAASEVMKIRGDTGVTAGKKPTDKNKFTKESAKPATGTNPKERVQDPTMNPTTTYAPLPPPAAPTKGKKTAAGPMGTAPYQTGPNPATGTRPPTKKGKVRLNELKDNHVEHRGNAYVVVHGHAQKKGSKTDKPKGTPIHSFKYTPGDKASETKARKKAYAMHSAIMHSEERNNQMETLGGTGSGNFGHEGRPGEVGGSGEGGSSAGADAGKWRRTTDRVDAQFEVAYAKAMKMQKLGVPDKNLVSERHAVLQGARTAIRYHQTALKDAVERADKTAQSYHTKAIESYEKVKSTSWNAIKFYPKAERTANPEKFFIRNDEDVQ